VSRHLAVIAVVLGVLGVTSACTIQPTPREYIDRTPPAQEVRRQIEAALRDQILLLIRALQAGDAETARAMLSPAENVIVIGPGAAERFAGSAQIESLLDLAVLALPGTLELRDLEVQLSPRVSVGWFCARLELRRADTSEPVPLRVSGVYVERGATWELHQAHLSVPAPEAFTGLVPVPGQ
jgi:hypothetical protein